MVRLLNLFCQPRQILHSLSVGMLLLLLIASSLFAQQPDQVERKVQNPIGDAEEERRALRKTAPGSQVNVTARLPVKDDEELAVTALNEEGKGNVVIYTGNVHLTYSDVTLIGDRATFNKTTNDVTVEGNVFFEQQGQSVTAERIEFNLETKRPCRPNFVP